jgi:hypothetical protein
LPRQQLLLLLLLLLLAPVEHRDSVVGHLRTCCCGCGCSVRGNYRQYIAAS